MSAQPYKHSPHTFVGTDQLKSVVQSFMGNVKQILTDLTGFEGGAISIQAKKAPAAQKASCTGQGNNTRRLRRAPRPLCGAAAAEVTDAIHAKLVEIGMQEQKRRAWETSLAYEQTRQTAPW